MTLYETPLVYFLWVLGAYILGSVSVGDLVARTRGVNIRSVGTGNPGTANVYREMGRSYGILVCILDVMKGIVATLPLYVTGFPPLLGLFAASALLAGHIFPILWKFHGGTGMATAMGTTLGLLPAGALVAIIPTVLAMKLTRNTGYTGGLFFLITVSVGSVFHKEAIGVIGVILVCMIILAKALTQYKNS